MSVSKPCVSHGPELSDPLEFSVLLYVLEYASLLDSVQFTDMLANDRVLTIPDWHDVLCDTDNSSLGQMLVKLLWTPQVCVALCRLGSGFSIH